MLPRVNTAREKSAARKKTARVVRPGQLVRVAAEPDPGLCGVRARRRARQLGRVVRVTHAGGTVVSFDGVRHFYAAGMVSP